MTTLYGEVFGQTIKITVRGIEVKPFQTNMLAQGGVVVLFPAWQLSVVFAHHMLRQTSMAFFKTIYDGNFSEKTCAILVDTSPYSDTVTYTDGGTLMVLHNTEPWSVLSLFALKFDHQRKEFEEMVGVV